MNIVQLPIEMLIEIFSYLSRYDEVCLVNKLFYSVECKLNDHNIRLRLDDRLIVRILIFNLFLNLTTPNYEFLP